MVDEGYAQEAPRSGGLTRKLGLGGAAILILGGAAAWMGSGQQTRWSDEANATTTAPNVESATLAAASSDAPAPTVADPGANIRGVIRPKLEATIASRITAKITQMPYREGQFFSKGALLVSFDCNTLRAQLNAANAATAAYAKTYETNVELDAYQAVGRNDVVISKANHDKASAEARAISAQMSDCAIYAPFAGVVVEQVGNAHEVAASGQPLMKIQNGADLEVQLIVPSMWLNWLKPGTPFDFRIDETGAVVKGEVRSLGAAVDPVSKTIRINGSLAFAEQRVLPGMSGSASFDVPVDGSAAAAKQATSVDSVPEKAVSTGGNVR